MKHNFAKHKNWRTFTIVLLFLITIIPAVGECFYPSGGIIDPPKLYTISFYNTSTTDTVVYFLYHIDHKFPRLRDALPTAGELTPGRSNFSTREGGIYYVVWKRNEVTVKATEIFKLTENMGVYYP